MFSGALVLDLSDLFVFDHLFEEGVTFCCELIHSHLTYLILLFVFDHLFEEEMTFRFELIHSYLAYLIPMSLTRKKWAFPSELIASHLPIKSLCSS